MRIRGRLKLSLDRKITFLFGGAVLLTIVATLAFPWVQMNTLTDRAARLRAEQVALLARQAILEPTAENWEPNRKRLADLWDQYQQDLSLTAPPPTLMSIEELAYQFSASREGFRHEAVSHFTEHPTEKLYWRFQEEGRRFRLAWAVRSPDTDPNPGRLRGIIDLLLPAPTEGWLWNSIVTLLAGACGAVLAMLVFYLVTQKLILSPLNALKDLAEQVTAGDLTVRARIDTDDEFQDLGQAFNDMLEHLSATQEELRRINRSLDSQLAKLAQTNVALYESDRLKNDFLANVSHELRTPLVSIIGFADLLNEAWDAPELNRRRLARYTHNILTSGRMLLDLINDLLDLAKIEAGKMELHVSKFPVAKICNDLNDFFGPSATKKNIRLGMTLENSLPVMESDSGKLTQILYNLMSNAIKFTPSGGDVNLSAGVRDEREVWIEVRDTGPGIPEDKIGRIFEKFSQLDSSRTREYEGTGLGLAITRELVSILGGRIELRSQVAQGSVFTVHLPLSLPRAK